MDDGDSEQIYAGERKTIEDEVAVTQGASDKAQRIAERLSACGAYEEINAAANIALFKRGKTITKAQIHKGNVPVVAGGLEPAYYHNVANTVAPVITISGSGANAGFARLYNVDVFASDCSFVDSQTLIMQHR